MRPWEELHDDEERAVYKAGSYGNAVPLGERPGVLLVDIVRSFTGDRGDDHLTSIAKYSTSCAPYAWAAMPHLVRLLESARAGALPVVYTRNSKMLPVLQQARGWRRPDTRGRPGEGNRARAAGEPWRVVDTIMHGTTFDKGSEFPEEIAPQPGDVVIEGPKPSKFYGSPLLHVLQQLGVDHLIVGGVSTSGCVRGTVYDAVNYNFTVTIVEECVFDRFPTSNKANLFDMNAKYASVRRLDDVLTELGQRARSGAPVATPAR
jgi:maleamate amidohydrolase